MTDTAETKLPGYTDEDMAAVGRSLMERLHNNRAHPFLTQWHPLDDPAEIVGDLLNALDEARAPSPSAMVEGVDVATLNELYIRCFARQRCDDDDAAWGAFDAAVRRAWPAIFAALASAPPPPVQGEARDHRQLALDAVERIIGMVRSGEAPDNCLSEGADEIVEAIQLAIAEAAAPPPVRMAGRERLIEILKPLVENMTLYGAAEREQVLLQTVDRILSLSPQGDALREAHKVMTAEEYAFMEIAGWHEVHRDYDGVGGVAVRYVTPQSDGWQAELRASAASELARDIATRGRPEQEFQAVQKCCERFRSVLEKIARRWPCSTADDMSRLAQEALPSPPQQEKG